MFWFHFHIVGLHMATFEREAAVYVLYASHNLQAAAFGLGTPRQSVLSLLGKHRVEMRELPPLRWPERFDGWIWSRVLGTSSQMVIKVTANPPEISMVRLPHLLKFTTRKICLKSHDLSRFLPIF